MVKRTLSKEEIILDALWHQCLCTSLLLSVNVRRQSLHLAVHHKPDCPSHCPVPFSPCCNPKTCTGQQLASYPAPPPPSFSIILCPLSPPGSLIVSQATYVSLISIWLWVTAIQSPQQAMVGKAAGRSVIDSELSVPKIWWWQRTLKIVRYLFKDIFNIYE